MKKLLALIPFFAAASLVAQDSLRVHELSIVRIEDVWKKWRTDERLSGPDSLQLSRSVSADLGRVLERGGWSYVATYGPPGTAALLRSAGLGPDHSTVLWNGLSMNSPTLGMADCSMIPAFLLDQMQATGTVFGSTVQPGLGTTYVLGSHVNWGKPSQVRVVQESSSLNNHFTGADVSVTKQRFTSRTRVFLQSIQNDFRYTDRYRIDRPVVWQSHNNGRGSGIAQQVGVHLGKHRIHSDVWYVQRSMLLPGVMGVSAPPDMHQDDIQVRAVATHRIPFLYRGWWVTSVAWIRDDQHYVQRTHEGATMVDAFTRANTVVASTGWEGNMGDHFLGGARVQGQDVRAEYDHRRSVEQQFAATEVYARWKNDRYYAHLSGRYEARTDTRGAWSLAAEQRVILFNGRSWHWQLCGDIFHRVRVPDLNERYWQPGGNPDLLPERARGAVLAIEWKRQASQWRVLGRSDARASLVDQWIQWMPVGVIWSPFNVREVATLGHAHQVRVERTNGRYRWAVHGKYQYLRSAQVEGNKLSDALMVYAPLHQAFGGADLRVRNWTFGAVVRSVSERYTDEANTRYLALDPYQLVDLNVSWNGSGRLRAMGAAVGVDNVFGTAYETVRAYAQPGRVLWMRLSCTINQQPLSSDESTRILPD